MAKSERVGSGTNFGHLEKHDLRLVKLGMLAERYFTDDPNTSILKLRQFAEHMAQLVASKFGHYTSLGEAQYDLLRRLQSEGILPREVAQLFGELRRTGNAANHDLAGDHRMALGALRVAWQLSVWFHRTFARADFKSGAFIPPTAPKDESEELRQELAELNRALATHRAQHQETQEQLASAESLLREASDERAFWEQMAQEADDARSELTRKLEEEQLAAQNRPRDQVSDMVSAARSAASQVELTEADTRRLIDAQLRSAGWTVDSEALTYAKGARPQKGKNLAISEWPTRSGPADYVLFVGLQPVAAVEAKRRNLDVSGSIQQAKRYSRDFKPKDGVTPPAGAPWGDHQLPFVFSSNGRPFLQQLRTRSGIWFCDVRSPENLSRPLEGWYTPEGLKELLEVDVSAAHAQLEEEGFDYGFALRRYQQDAIRAVEAGIEAGHRELLLAMATGTGKTKTCVALLYRLLKVKRFRRILFVVDRESLGEQAANAFKDTRMESLQTFADVFGLKELGEHPDTDTKVQVATIQAMVQRVFGDPDDPQTPTVDQYDCIVVDECHRGYLLDRELSDTELGFRSFDDYVSKYRRVLDSFDAVKIGLTATPALHTTEIFGPPIFTYGYREAVLDGYLVDYEPPYQIHTELADGDIVWAAGEEVQVIQPSSEIDLVRTPDEIRIDVSGFNKKVITESFNRVVCEHLAQEIDPSSREKTLIFCVNDAHADLVVNELKQAFKAQYGSVEDDAVMKITGRADRPMHLIRSYKNEKLPSVAVTVDLLTTGVDVPEICNLVFLRRVNSRILFDQMLGRATRLCDEIGKQAFRVFDAVRAFEAIQNLTAMQPVVVDPSITFDQLVRELAGVEDDAARELVRDQFVAKLQRKKRHLDEAAAHDFETQVGMAPDAFIRKLREMSLEEVGAWFTQNPQLGELLDRKRAARPQLQLVSKHIDRVRAVERGYGRAPKPEDYLKAFEDFVRSHVNEIAALNAVLTRPRELTRKDLRTIALELDRAGFTERGLRTAWAEVTNQDVAARIVGYIRQAALGDPLRPYDQRVEEALQRILSSRSWTRPQRDWLTRIAKQTKANLLVDRMALDDPDQIFKRDGGGFDRLNRIFSGELQQVLDAFNDALWGASA